MCVKIKKKGKKNIFKYLNLLVKNVLGSQRFGGRDPPFEVEDDCSVWSHGEAGGGGD